MIHVLLRLGLILSLLAVAGCGQPPLYRQQAYVFGTLVEVSVQGLPEAQARQAVDQVLQEFDRMHRELHAWEAGPLDSLNAAIARGESASVPAEVASLLADAARFSARADHLFNPAIGNLIRLWGFQSDTFESRLPPAAEVARWVAAQPRMTDLVSADGRISSHNPAVRLDLGGYAKGYALDRAATLLRARGVNNALVNIGGNILALGRHGDRPWRVGIQHPRQNGAIATLDLADGEAIGTSGDYQRYFEYAGKRYCHLIDPRTGWPAQGVQAVTVLARGKEAGVLSDVASKPLFISGPTGWRAMATRMGVTDALLVDAAGRVQVTAGLAGRLRWEKDVPPATVVP